MMTISSDVDGALAAQFRRVEPLIEQILSENPIPKPERWKPMTLRMHAENVLVLFDIHDPKSPAHPKNRVTDGGIFIPEQVKPAEALTEGVWATVIKSGPGHHDARGHWIPNETRPGMRVLVDSPNAGDRYFIGGVEHRIVREPRNVMAVVE